MGKSNYLKGKLIILIIILMILIVKLILIRDEYFSYIYQERGKVKEDQRIIIEEKYGYGEFLEVLRRNKDLQLKAINMSENEKCNIEVSYIGDIKLLYNCLYSLNENRNFLGVNSISINKDGKNININVDFKKNK